MTGGGVFWPVSASHVCGGLSARSTIHAVVLVDAVASDRASASGLPRSVCGSDVFPIVLSNGVVPSWPPPVEVRCSDCADRLGTRGRRAGSPMWAGVDEFAPAQLRAGSKGRGDRP